MAASREGYMEREKQSHFLWHYLFKQIVKLYTSKAISVYLPFLYKASYLTYCELGDYLVCLIAF